MTTTEQQTTTTQDDVRAAWNAFTEAAQTAPGGTVLDTFRDYLRARQAAAASWQEYLPGPADAPPWPGDDQRRGLSEEYRTLTGILQGAAASNGTAAAGRVIHGDVLARRVEKYRADVTAWNQATAAYAAYHNRPAAAVPQENPQGIAPPSPAEAPVGPHRNYSPLHMPWPVDFSEALTAALTAG